MTTVAPSAAVRRSEAVRRSQTRERVAASSVDDRVIRAALLVLPSLAYATIWLSLRPGAPGQVHACRLATVLLLGVAVAGSRTAWRASGATVRWAIAFAVLVAVQGVAWLAASDIDRQRDLAQVSGALLMLDVLLLVSGRTDRLRTLVHGIVLGALVVLVIAAVEYASGLPMETRVGRPWPFGKALAATFTNPNSLAAHAAVFIGVFLGYGIAGARHKLMCWTLAASAALVALLTLSRSAVLAIVGSLIVLLVIVSDGRAARIVPRLVIFLLCGSAAWLLWGERFDAYYASISGGAQESDAARRLMLERAFAAMTSRAGLGMGPGRFEASVVGQSGDMRGISNIHNSFVEVGVAYGLVPALILLVVLVGSVTQCARYCARDRLLGVVGMSCGLSVILGALVASSILGDSAWWIALAVCLLCAQSLARANE